MKLESISVRMRRLPWWHRLLIAVFPPLRRAYEMRVRRSVRFIMEHPEMPITWE